MSWLTSITDIRSLLSDQSNDKFSFRKKVFGVQDGSNKTFKTFEIRRVTDFTSASSGVGVYVNSNYTGVASDDPVTGEFTLLNAPTQKDRIEASYYHQWFNDSQLDSFLRFSSNYIGQGDSYSDTPEGLRPVVLKFATSEAYQELSVRFARMLSEQFRIEDLPKEAIHAAIDSYNKMAENYRDSAEKLLKNFYTRQGQNFAPLFGFVKGKARDVAPNR